MNLTSLLLISTASWYIADAITHRSGPAGIFHKLRSRLQSDAPGSAGELVRCIYCTMFYVSIIVWSVYVFLPEAIMPFSAAGLALMLRSYSGAGMHE